MTTPMHIVADIGGTNARFAYLEAGADALQGIEVFPCAEFTFLADALGTYIERGHVENIDHICLAVAGPVEADWIDTAWPKVIDVEWTDAESNGAFYYVRVEQIDGHIAWSSPIWFVDGAVT